VRGVDEAGQMQAMEEVHTTKMEEMEVHAGKEGGEGGEGGQGGGADLDDDCPGVQASGEGALAHHGDAGHLEHRRGGHAVVRDP